MFDLASVKAWLGITVGTWDSEIADLMTRALDAVQRDLDWYFGTGRAATETLDGTGTRALWLRQPPLAGVVVAERSGIGADWATVDSDTYENGGRGLFNVGNWTEGVRNFRATYTEGFATMPGDIEQLLLDLVAAKWRGRSENPGMKSETIGDYSYTRGDLEASERWASVKARWHRGRI